MLQPLAGVVPPLPQEPGERSGNPHGHSTAYYLAQLNKVQPVLFKHTLRCNTAPVVDSRIFAGGTGPRWYFKTIILPILFPGAGH